MAKAGKLGAVKQLSSSITITDEACSLVSGKTYKITDRSKRILDGYDVGGGGILFTVKDNAVAVSSSDIKSINYMDGSFTFVDTYTVVGAITVTAKRAVMSTVASVKSWSASFSADMLDSTDLEKANSNGGWRTKDVGLKQVTGSLVGFADIAGTWFDKIKDDKLVIIELKTDYNNDAGSIAIMARLSGVNEDVKVEDLANLTINFESVIPAAWEI